MTTEAGPFAESMFAARKLPRLLGAPGNAGFPFATRILATRFCAFALLFLSAPILLACAGARSEYESALDHAQQASRRGDFREARQRYLRAAALATSPGDEVEARYRAATQMARLGAHSAAANAFKALAHQHPRSERAARAWLDCGRAWEREGRRAHARRCYREVWTTHATSGLAVSALRRDVALSSEPKLLAWQRVMQRIHAEPAPKELEAAARYYWGRALSEAGDVRRAVEQLELSARTDPLPRGAFADDALLLTAQLRRDHKDFAGALQALRILLESRTESVALGSYERSSFAPARMMEAEILRDDLRDWKAAELSFLRIAEIHQTSRLVDDALWQAAWLAKASRRPRAACEYSNLLVSKRPLSRYEPCLGLVCRDRVSPSERNEKRCLRVQREIPSDVRGAAGTKAAADTKGR